MTDSRWADRHILKIKSKISKISSKKREIVSYYLFNFFIGCYLAGGTNVLFQQALGFSYSQIFSIEAFYMLLFIFFEAPTGALADLIGRKRCVALGAFILALATLATGASHSYAQVFMSYILWSIGFSMISGANQAMLFDSLNNEDAYSSILGRSTLIMLVGSIIGDVVGPQLFKINFRLPFFFSMIPFLLSATSIMFFRENMEFSKHGLNLKKHFHLMREGAIEVFKNAYIRWSTLVMALAFGVSYTMANAYQPYLKGVGFSVGSFSFVLPLLSLSQGLGGIYSKKISQWFGESRTFFVILLLMGLTIMFLGVEPARPLIVLLAIYSLVQGIITPLVSVYANRHISTDRRATIISVQGTVSTAAAALPLLLLGYLTDRIGLNPLLVIFGLLIIIAGLFILKLKPRTA